MARRGRGQPLFVFPERLNPRVREGGHLWCDLRPLRFFRKSFPKKIHKNFGIIYQALCQIDSDFYKQREDENFAIGSLTKTCATYGGVDIKTATTYMQLLKDLTLIDYGRKKDKSGKVIGSYLVMYEWIPFIEYYEIFVSKNEFLKDNYKHDIDPNIIDPFSKDTYETVEDDRKNHIPKNGGMGKNHIPKKPYKVKRGGYKNVNNFNKNESKDSKDSSYEESVGFQRKPLNSKTSLKVKIYRGLNKKNNGRLYNISTATKSKRAKLNGWNHHDLKRTNSGNKDDKNYLEPIIALKDKIINRKIVLNHDVVEEVMNYWNKNARTLSNNGKKIPTHRMDLDTKVSYMCKIIIIGLLHTSHFTKEDIKRAIDSYVTILEDSSYYRWSYTFPQFFGNQNLFTNCVEGNLERYKLRSNTKLTDKDLLHLLTEKYKKNNYGDEPSHDIRKVWRHWIKDGTIKSKEDFYKADM